MTNEPLGDDERIRRLVASCQAAFPADAERPAPDSVVSCISCDNSEIAEYFAWAERYGNSPMALCARQDAIHAFSGGALVYWLPAFMVAELEDSHAAGGIGSLLRDALSFQDWLGLAVFTSCQRDVVVEFLLECSRRYDEPLGEAEDEDESTFRSTAEIVRRWTVA